MTGKAKFLGNAWKAAVGFVAPGAVVIAGAINDSSPGGSRITSGEWVLAITAAVITAASVYGTPPGKGLRTPGA